MTELYYITMATIDSEHSYCYLFLRHDLVAGVKTLLAVK
jgi:hypothetical protein